MSDLPDQSWYWHPEWQRGEREATDQIDAGRTTFHPDVDHMFASLREHEHDT